MENKNAPNPPSPPRHQDPSFLSLLLHDSADPPGQLSLSVGHRRKTFFCGSGFPDLKRTLRTPKVGELVLWVFGNQAGLRQGLEVYDETLQDFRPVSRWGWPSCGWAWGRRLLFFCFLKTIDVNQFFLCFGFRRGSSDPFLTS